MNKAITRKEKKHENSYVGYTSLSLWFPALNSLTFSVAILQWNDCEGLTLIIFMVTIYFHLSTIQTQQGQILGHEKRENGPSF